MDQEETLRFLPNRLDHEPVIFRGMSNTEVFFITGVSFVFWVVVCTLVGLLFGAGLMGMGAAALITMATVILSGSRLQVIKRNLPDGHHIVKFRVWLQEKGFKDSGYCMYSGQWDIRRQKD